MKIQGKLRLTIGLWCCLATLGVVGQSSHLGQANKLFENLAYREATQVYEQALGRVRSLSVVEKQSAALKLAYSYRQLRDTQNAERVYRELLSSNPTLSGEDLKAYLYFAQALASNGKYKESALYWEKYQQLQAEDNRGEGFTKLYQNVSKLQRNAVSYQVEYLSINSGYADFSAVPYKSGLVFCSGRNEGSNFVRRIFSWDKSPFLDLYFLPDTKVLEQNEAASLGGAKQSKNRGGNRSLGSDEYTSHTANDSHTVGSYGDGSATDPYRETPKYPSVPFSKAINSKYHEGPATFSSDGKRIIFTRNNYNNGKYKTSSDRTNKLKLYSAEEKSGNWGNIKELPFNSDEYSCGHPALSKDDRLLIFASDMPGGFGGTDLYIVQSQGDSWGSPVNLGAAVNSKGNELFPFLDERGSLYFSSDGHPGLGDLDLFFVELRNGVPVGKPRNLEAPLNSTKDDFAIVTDGERTKGYLSSNRKRGNADDDIYRFSRSGSLFGCQDVNMIVFDGETRQPLGGAFVEVSTAEEKPVSKITDINGSIDLCLEDGKQYTVKSMREGYVPSTVALNLQNNESAKLEIPLQKLPPMDSTTSLSGVVRNAGGRPVEGVTVELKSDCGGPVQRIITGPSGEYQFELDAGCDYTLESTKTDYGVNVEKIKRVNLPKKNPVFDVSLLKEGDVIPLDNIYYNLGKHDIRPDAARELDRLVATLVKYPEMLIEIRSHTDSRGDNESNRSLSERRATAVVDYLASKGVSKGRMQASGYGETLPINECIDGVRCSEAEFQRNRRTEFMIIKLR